jgi:hypothetical protein
VAERRPRGALGGAVPPHIDGANLTNSYSTIYLAPSNRIYVMYNRNSDNIIQVPGVNHSVPHLGDELGHHCMKYSDDGGRSWSAARYEVPIPTKPIDEANPWHGQVKMFWTVDQVEDAARVGVQPAPPPWPRADLRPSPTCPRPPPHPRPLLSSLPP